MQSHCAGYRFPLYGDEILWCGFESNKLFYRQWVRLYGGFYWSYRISTDLWDWIKYTLLHRKRRVVLAQVARFAQRPNGEALRKKSQIIQVAFKTEIFSCFRSLKLLYSQLKSNFPFEFHGRKRGCNESFSQDFLCLFGTIKQWIDCINPSKSLAAVSMEIHFCHSKVAADVCVCFLCHKSVSLFLFEHFYTTTSNRSIENS